MSQALRSYTKVYAMGHAALEKLRGVRCTVEEKVDGSQFSFGVIDGELKMRSRNREINGSADAGKLFAKTCVYVESLFKGGRLVEGWTYRGEAICGPRHNVLTYERAPKGNLVLWDVDFGMEDYASPDERANIALSLGFEAPPVYGEITYGQINEAGKTTADQVRDLLTTTSMLGAVPIEGVVIKPLREFAPDCIARDGKRLAAKYVSEGFKEIHRKNFKSDRPQKVDVITRMVEMFGTEARMHKAVQHLREAGELTESVKDIGPLIREFNRDLMEECHEEMGAVLLAEFRKEILRQCTRGIPQWWKDQLADRV